jgi:hypothetical protein
MSNGNAKTETKHIYLLGATRKRNILSRSVAVYSIYGALPTICATDYKDKSYSILVKNHSKS